MKNVFKLISTLIVFFTLQTLTFAADPMSQLFKQGNNAYIGNPNGKITIAEFFDYQCSHCMSMAGTMSKIAKDNKDVRVVFKDFPIRGESSTVAAKAAIAAGMQGKYSELNHAMLTLNQPLTEDNIFKIAESVGINVAKLKTDMKSSEVKKQIIENTKLASELNITGTPAFFIGKTDAKNIKQVNFVLGEMSQTELQEAIDNALKA